jgi:hypothetical protein
MNNKHLFLHEEILLLALRDYEGTIASGTMYQYALGGALLAELLINNRIKVVETRWSKLVELVDSTPVGEPLIDECLDKISKAKRRGSLQTWVTRFANIRELKHRIARKLCDRRILKADEDKVLLIFTRRIYPELNPIPERQLKERLRKAIFSHDQDIDPRTIILISLAESSGLLKLIFDRTQLKRSKTRIKQITNGEITGKAAKEAIDAVHAAIAVTAIMPAIIASTTAST